ncbi:MAG TPA: 6-phosphogluconolactonase [Gemmatimonadaceae bacterium]|nr:6-phosphogluconolactonase [Gemmatimonadaceae bacterium]
MTERHPEVLVGDDPTLQARLCAIIDAAARRAARDGRRWSVAVPGGSVAARLLPALAAAEIPWSQGDLFWVDERVVPWSHPESNYGAARAGWLRALEGSALRVHPVPVEAPSLAECAERYEATVRACLGPRATLDVAILGVGEDGHVASLFPGHDAALDSTRLVVPVEGAPKPPPARVSLTMPVLARAHAVVVAAYGDAKRPVIAEAVRGASPGEGHRLPVARLVQASPRVILLLDRAAAPDGGAAA